MSDVPALPVETWQHVFSFLDPNYASRTLVSLCSVCKLFNAIGQPMLYEEIRFCELYNPALKKALSHSRALFLGSLVKEVQVRVVLDMVPLCDEEEWQVTEMQHCRKKTEALLKDVLTTLEVCPNIRHLDLSLAIDDFVPSKSGGYFNPSHDGSMVQLPIFDFLDSPLLNSLRMLSFTSDASAHTQSISASDAFRTYAVSQLIAEAPQLESVALVEVYETELFLPFNKQIRKRPKSSHTLKRLSHTLRNSNIDWIKSRTVAECLQADLMRLPMVSWLRLEWNDVWEELAQMGVNLGDSGGISTINSLTLFVNQTTTWNHISSLARIFPALQQLHLQMSDKELLCLQRSAISSTRLKAHLQVKTLILQLDLETSQEEEDWLQTELRVAMSAICDAPCFTSVQNFRLLLDLPIHLGHVDLKMVARIRDVAEAACEAYPLSIIVEVIVEATDLDGIGQEGRYRRRALRDAAGWRRYDH